MSHRVLVQPGGREFTVEGEESVLYGALRQGVVLPYGCRDGACGSCKGRIVSGSIRYGEQEPSALYELSPERNEALLCQARPRSDLVIEAEVVDAAQGIPINTFPCKVVDMERLCHNVELLRLKLPSSRRMQFLAGQYINVLLKDGRHRAFSIANPPHKDEFIELHIRHVPDGEFSHRVFTEMHEKAILRIQGPLGTYFLREDSDRPVILIGGGTGFAPLKAMLEHAFHIGITRPIHLFWGARAKADLYLHELPLAWARQHANFDYTPVLSEPADDDGWTGETGLVTDAVVRQYGDLSAWSLYMSGPPPMVHGSKQLFLDHGIPEDQMFSDAFEFAPK